MTASNGVADAPAARRERIPLAILYMVGATIVFAVSSAASKWLVATYPAGEVLFTRTFSALIALGLFILPSAGLAVYRTRRPGAHLLRGLSQSCSQTLLIIAFSMMPLGSATAINFSAPLFATLASAVFLKETVGAARWTALLVGFLGVLLVTGPGAETFQIGALFALGNAIMYGTLTAGVRGMTATESTGTLTMYQLTLLSADLRADAAARHRHADAGRRAADGGQRHCQRGRAVLVDARTSSRADIGGGAVPVSVAGLGDHPRPRRVGRRADGRRC